MIHGIVFLIILSIAILFHVNASNLNIDKTNSSYFPLNINNDIVWWNMTELNTELYTAPFFKIYKLIDFGQTAFGLATADFNNDS